MNKTTFLLFLFVITPFLSFTQSSAIYDINFTSTWNSGHHGTLPGNAHWSNLVGANHNSNITFLEMGQVASAGIEDVAELGSNTVFNSEVQNAINGGNAEQWLQQPFSPFAAISSATLSDITVSQEFPLLTLVSMIAPSPDWIIAVNSLNLWDESTSDWKDSFSIDLFPYDAGTEDGFNYATNNAPTVPQGIISLIADAPGYPFGPEKIGTLTITFKGSTLSTDNPNLNQTDIKIYQKPNTIGQLNFANGLNLKDITFYDAMGKITKQLKVSGSLNNFSIDVSDLRSGFYIVRLTDNTNKVENRKVILN